MRKRVLLVDDDPTVLYSIKKVLSQKGFEVYTLESPDGMEDYLDVCDVLLMDIRLKERSGVDVVYDLRAKGIKKPVVFITAYTDFDNIVKASKLGSVEILKKPFDAEDLIKALERAIDSHQPLLDVCREEYKVIGVSEAMFEVFKKVGMASANDLNVLITGETGVGKDLIARLIHLNSSRKDSPFVVINCPSIPWDLFEIELFGCVKGAFTGAIADKKGKAELAEGGTLFFNEIGDLPYKLQAKLLDFIERKSFYPVGGSKEVKADVRLIFATNKNLRQLTREDKFREDLYHRISQMEIYIPPLRERKEDIPALINFFISTANKDLGLKVVGISEKALQKALEYPWYGNVRELKNVIYKAALDTKAGKIEDLPLEEKGSKGTIPSLSDFLDIYISSKKEEELSNALEELEVAFIKKLLERYSGNKSKVAQLLGISRNTLNAKLKEI
ncbi:MAG: sigma-54-dependent transcriptional regulator [Aquificaceae bacterium]